MSFSISNRVSGEEAGGESFLEFRASDLPADLVEVFLAFAFSISYFAKLLLISFALFLSSQSKVWVFCIQNTNRSIRILYHMQNTNSSISVVYQLYRILIDILVFCSNSLSINKCPFFPAIFSNPPRAFRQLRLVSG